MKRMLEHIIPFAAACLLMGSPCALASIGTGIGISFPVAPSHEGRAAASESYAAFRYGQIAQELIVTEKDGGLRLELRITNGSDAPYAIEHRDGQSYDFAILDKDGQPLYRWSDSMAFTQALASAVYPPHETVVHTAEIARKEYRAIRRRGVLAVAFLTDTPYALSARLPAAKASAPPMTLHGSIILGNGHWPDD